MTGTSGKEHLKTEYRSCYLNSNRGRGDTSTKEEKASVLVTKAG
jgi:hypothetical protein